METSPERDGLAPRSALLTSSEVELMETLRYSRGVRRTPPVCF